MRAMRGRWQQVVVLVSVVAVAAVVAPVSDAQASTRSKGQLFVFDSDNCTGLGNSPKVTVPASVGGRDYPPDIDMDLYATDTATDERFGPFVAHSDGNGDFCLRVTRARATQWKIELIEPGSGFTDSKVVTVLSPPPPATTTTPTTTPVTTTPVTTTPVTTTPVTTTTSPPTTPPTTGAETTTTGAATTTTTTAVTTTAAPSTTIAATTTTLVDSSGRPIELVPTPVPPEWSLPTTGASAAAQAGWALVSMLLGGALVVAVRRRRPTLP